jgi:hypothetical protein
MCDRAFPWKRQGESQRSKQMAKLAIKVLSLRTFKSRKKRELNTGHNLIIVDLLYSTLPITESGRELPNLSYKGDGRHMHKKDGRGFSSATENHSSQMR